MSPVVKGLVVAVVQVGLVASLGAKLLYDRATLPRVWVRTAPYDPNLPIRGRYVRLQLVVEPLGLRTNPDHDESSLWSVALRVADGGLVAQVLPRERHDDPGTLRIRFIRLRGERRAVLDTPAAFFVPEDVADPSRRPVGEELWVETTIPKKGPPRPIRLGVKKSDGPVVPLALR